MAFYSFIFTANYKRFFTRLKKVATEEKRSFIAMVLDTGWCVFRYGLALTDYLTYKIYKRSAKERREYIGTRTMNQFYATVSPEAHKQRFTQKPIFLRDFSEYTKRSFLVPAECDFETFDAFLNSHEAFMSKPFDGLGGQDVRKVFTQDIPDRKAYYDHCVANRIFLEELVIQHEEMNTLCAASVNTIRVMTYYNHGAPYILWMGMRVGSGKSPVDNFTSGGMVVAIDRERGCLKGNAIDKQSITFTTHPATGVAFDGFPIPCFDQIADLTLEAARKEDKILVVGWDVAISQQGPVLIEGNRRPGFGMSQVLDDRGRMDMVREVLSDLGKKI